MFKRCRNKKKKNNKCISEYIRDLKDLDTTLQLMGNRVQVDIGKLTENVKLKNITKATLRRRILLKKHYTNIDNRRTQVLGRILQLENLHLNSLQVNSLKNVTRAHEDININPDDVEELIDKLATFQEDFEEISEQLNESMDFNINISEEELEAELLKEQESVTKHSEGIKVEFPEINVSKQDFKGKQLEGTMDNKDERYRPTTTYA